MRVMISAKATDKTEEKTQFLEETNELRLTEIKQTAIILRRTATDKTPRVIRLLKHNHCSDI